MNVTNMDWSKHAKKKSIAVKERRLSIVVTTEMEKVMGFFRSQNPDIEFSDTGIMMTFIEAGLKVYIAELQRKKANSDSVAGNG